MAKILTLTLTLITLGLTVDGGHAFAAPQSDGPTNSPTKNTTKITTKSPNLDLIIELKGLPAVETVSNKPLKFESTCDNFGAYLSKNRGLWGTGPFATVKCVVGKSNKEKPATDSSEADWRLEISAEDENKTFSFFFREPDNTFSKIASYTVETAAGPITLMSKKNLNQLLAFYLSQTLPFRSAIPAENSSADKGKLSGSVGSLTQVKPADELVLFELRRVDKVWHSRPVGVATLQGADGKKASWKIETKSASTNPPPYYFVQQIDGREELLRRTDQMIKDDMGSLLGGLLAIGRSAYIGGRYGVPLGGKGVIAKAALIGLFADLRSGLASGIKVNYDLVSKQEYSDATSDQEFQWSRFQLGYSFLRQVRWGIINQIDATPRLGVTTLKYDFTPAANSELDPTHFSINRAPTVGLEIGAEKNTFLARFRLWTFGSFSVGVLPLDKNNSTSSLRVGLDAYRDLFKMGRAKMAILGFTSYESTKITQKTSSEDVAAGYPAETSLMLKNVYAGGGATITW